MAQKTLLEHAAYELTRAGLTNHEEPSARKTAEDTMALLRRFVKQNHDETTGRYTLEFFETLANFLPLSPITDNPEEWEKFTVKSVNEETKEETTVTRWQSKRAPSFISEDDGKTWTDMKSGRTGTSVDHVKEAARVEEEKKNSARIEKKRKADNAKKLKEADTAKAEKEATDGKQEKPGTQETPDTPADGSAPAPAPNEGGAGDGSSTPS